MTKEQAGLHFQDRVQQMQKERSLDFTVAWAQARAMYPELFARAFSGGDPAEPPKVRLAGSYDSSDQLIAPLVTPLPYTGSGAGQPFAAGRFPSRPISIPNEGSIESLGLPTDTSFEEFRAADLANCGASPRNSAGILEALIGLIVQNGTNPDAAREIARTRFPVLAAEADPKLVSRMGAPASALSNGTDAEVNSREQVASRKAHLASSLAEGKQGHLVAAAAHEGAAEAQSNARDYETADMHRRMATYHASQANQPEKS
jgi:hypothetical protein